MATVRTDIHRPSVIQPGDYEFVGFRIPANGDLLDAYESSSWIQAIRRHMDSTGGKYSSHLHGGSCHVCGAMAVYMAVFYHSKTNTYIQTGYDCASKFMRWSPGQSNLFRSFKKEVKGRVVRGQKKAVAFEALDKHNLEVAWDIAYTPWNEIIPDDTPDIETQRNRSRTIRDLVDKLVKFKSLSDKQWSFLSSLVDQFQNHLRHCEEKEAERAITPDVPDGKIEVEGEVLSVKLHDSPYGSQWKMLVQAVPGFKLWLTVPVGLKKQFFKAYLASQGAEDTSDDIVDMSKGNHYYLSYLKGAKVVVSGRTSPSSKDSKFGFVKNPKGKLISLAS